MCLQVLTQVQKATFRLRIFPISFHLCNIFFHVFKLNRSLLKKIALRRSKSCDQISLKQIESKRKFFSCFVDKNSYQKQQLIQVDDKANFSLLLSQAVAFKIDYTFWSNYKKRETDASVIQDQTSKYVVIDSRLAKPGDFECSLCIRQLN